MDIEVLPSVDQVSAGWLTQVLKARNLITSSVTNVKIERFGEGVGLMAELARLTLTYEGTESFSNSLVLKCAAQNDNRQIALILDFYNREVDFYNKIGQESGIQTPEIYFGGVNSTDYDQAILMQDLGSFSPTDQLVGATEEEAFSAIKLISGLHAKYWNRVSDEAWMYPFMSADEAIKLRDMLYLPSIDSAFEKFSSNFNDKTRRICQHVGEHYPKFWVDNVSKAETFIHGDYRQDNFFYPKDGSEAIVMDWQISGRGKGIFDVTYFICQSLEPKLRRQIEQELIRYWIDNLSQNGVTHYDFETAYRDYRHLVLACLVYPMTVCGSLDPSNERGRALGESMLTRNLQAIEELKCEELF